MEASKKGPTQGTSEESSTERRCLELLGTFKERAHARNVKEESSTERRCPELLLNYFSAKVRATGFEG